MNKNIDGKYQNMIIDNSKLISDIENLIEEKLADYVKFTDYAKSNASGVIKVDGNTGSSISNTGILMSTVRNYTQYSGLSDYTFISKGTLENVITGKGLNPKTFTGYDATKTQVLKNVEGTLTWVTEE